MPEASSSKSALGFEKGPMKVLNRAMPIPARNIDDASIEALYSLTKTVTSTRAAVILDVSASVWG